jgi:hypothetical protein
MDCPTRQELQAIIEACWNGDETLESNICRAMLEAIKYQRRSEPSRLNPKGR